MKRAILLLTILAVVVVPAISADRPLPSDARQVATLLTDTYSGETILLAEISGDVKLDQDLYVLARDKAHWDAVEVAHVFGSFILLKDQLPRDYLIGSRLLQR